MATAEEKDETKTPETGADTQQSTAESEAAEVQTDEYLKALESGNLFKIEKHLGKFYNDQTKPNIAFIGKRKGREPITEFSDGMDSIKITQDQTKPFYHKDAQRIIAVFPELYKPVID